MRQIKFEADALSELEDWVRIHPKTALKILDLLKEITKTPFEGKGKPETPKNKYKAFWSGRISDDHRLIYEVATSQLAFYPAGEL